MTIDIPNDWTPHQAMIVVELLDELRERIWDQYHHQLLDAYREDRQPTTPSIRPLPPDNPPF